MTPSRFWLLSSNIQHPASTAERNVFVFGRYSSGYGEEYDYNSILHYSATAFSKDNESVTLLPRVGEPDMIGKKKNLSDTDIVKIKKMYKCKPYEGWWGILITFSGEFFLISTFAINLVGFITRFILGS